MTFIAFMDEEERRGIAFLEKKRHTPELINATLISIREFFYDSITIY